MFNRVLIAVLITTALIGSAADAQQFTPAQYQAIIQAVRQQRDVANDQAAQFGAQLSLANKELADLKAKVEAEKKPTNTDPGK